jgi:hypothetical protein
MDFTNRYLYGAFGKVTRRNTDGTGGGPLLNGHSFVVPLMPGEKPLVGESSRRIVGLSPDLKERLKLAGPMRVIVVLVVAKVEYADGSAFSDMKTVKALTDYFVDINSEAIDSKARGIPSRSVPVPREK